MKKQAILFSGALILLIIGIALVVYFFTRKSKTEETGDLPTVKDAGIELVLNPADTANKVEEYSIFTREYAIGETTAKNIDILLKWTNGPNFGSVKSLIFVHKANDKQVRENVETDHNTQSNKSYELLFKGEQLTSEDIVGDNTIVMYYTTENSADIIELTTISFRIEQHHLDTILKSDNAIPVEIEVKLSSSSEASGGVIATYTNYHIPPFFTDDPVRIRTVSADSESFHIMNDNNEKQIIDGVDTFYIVNALGKDFISKDGSGNYILNGNKKFVSKDDIFGDINIMNSSSIKISVVGKCSFVLPTDSTGNINAWFSTTKMKNLLKKRCEDKASACENSGKFFTLSDFDYETRDCSLLPSSLRPTCRNINAKMEEVYGSAENLLKDKEYRDMCKTVSFTN